MGTISSSTGLISGFDIAGVVSQLMEIESRPLEQIKTRIANVQAQQMAYSQLSAKILSASGSIARLAQASAFKGRTASSSVPEVLTATSKSSAAVGTYSFLVRSVVSTHQMASQGFVDRNLTPVGAGTLTFEPAAARVDTDTELGTLNGGEGVRRGRIRIADRSGSSAIIDLRAVYTMGDVLEAINSQSDVAVRAYTSGDRLVIEDETGLSTGALTVSNVSGSFTATDLGVVGPEDGSGRITSSADLLRLTEASLLSSLNDKLGVRYSSTQADVRITVGSRTFDINLTNQASLSVNLAELNGGQGVGEGTIRITNKLGATKELALEGTETLGDIDAMLAADAAFGVRITSVSSSGSILLTDNNADAEGKLMIEDVSGTIAEQLGLAGETEEASLTGKMNYQFSTIESLIRKIEYARDADGAANNGAFEIAVSDDGKGLSLVNHSGEAITITALNDSAALEDLGLTGTFVGDTLTGRRVVSGLNTVLLRNLNGGSGVELGAATFTLRDGSVRNVDFTGAQTLQDVINRINEQDALLAEVSAGGTGLVITDMSTGGGTFSASGMTLDDLNIGGTSDTGRLIGGDLNRKYISEGTLLSALNAGEGIGITDGDGTSTAKFQITNSLGVSTIVSLSGSLNHTIGDVIDTINETMADQGVTARVNDAGDGIELTDANAEGTGQLSVAEYEGGKVAAALGIKGQADAGNAKVLTGSFAAEVEVGPADTLEDLVTKINSAGADVRASIINDGSGSRPYRLVLTSSTSGTAGKIAYAAGETGLDLNTLTEAQDARVLVGSLDSSSSILINSSTNEIKNVDEGVTLNLVAASDTPVQVSVTHDIDSTVADLTAFVESYNAVLDYIDEVTAYDAETEERGVLLGDSAARQIRDQLQRGVSHILPSSYELQRLASVGVTSLDESGKPLGGGRIRLDEARFREAVSENPEAVVDLFTKVEVTTGADGEEELVRVGIANRLNETLRAMTSSSGGLLTNQSNRLEDQVELFNNRIAEMEELLDAKEARYYAQFQAMETALAELQSQQSALSSLSSALSTYSTSNSGTGLFG